MRISDWSSDVCSSDLAVGRSIGRRAPSSRLPTRGRNAIGEGADYHEDEIDDRQHNECLPNAYRSRRCKITHEAVSKRRAEDRKSVAEGKRGSVSGDIGGRRSLKKKKRLNKKSN